MQINVPQFDGVRVLVAGDVMLDRYWFGATQRISPEAPVPVVHVRDIEERPGGAGKNGRHSDQGGDPHIDPQLRKEKEDCASNGGPQAPPDGEKGGERSAGGAAA